MSLDSIIRKYTIQHDRKIKKICAPLTDGLEIPYFSHFSLDSEGTFTFLANFPEQVDYYFSKRLYLDFPYFVHPDLLREGSLLIDATPDPDELVAIQSRFQVRQLLMMIEKNGNRLEGAFFSTNYTEMSRTFFLHDYALLKRFAKYFAKEAAPLIKMMRADRYSMKEAKGTAFQDCPANLALRNRDPRVERFLTSMYPLSQREQECLDLYRKGYNAKETAKMLSISPRTVEYYFENIKNKLGCYFKHDLLQL